MPSYHIGNKELTIKINDMNFYVGQEVVCIDPIDGWLKKGVHYIIYDLVKCKCGQIFISWGAPAKPSDGVNYCYKCLNTDIAIDGDTAYAKIERFAPIESIPASHEIAVKKLIEESQTIFN